MNILDEIFAHKHIEVAARQSVLPLAELRRKAEQTATPLPFAASLRRPTPQSALRLIAEVKCASPSRGLLVPHFDPLALARGYRQAGASAISVLTDEQYFKGSLAYLEQIAALNLALPLLRKDFIYDPYQVYEARAAGASAILLIAAALEIGLLAELQALAQDLNMDALVEVHNPSELEAVLKGSPALIGINNRDLRDFKVDLNTCLSLRPLIPTGVTVVAESGIHTAADVARLASGGLDAMLVGESLVTAPDPAVKIKELLT
jgi:indole-3-glycerol phosphate synthase